MLLVLLLLGAYFSYATLTPVATSGSEGGKQLAHRIASEYGSGSSVLIAVKRTDEDRAMAAALEAELTDGGLVVLDTVEGDPADANRSLTEVARSGSRLDVIACSPGAAAWTVFDKRLNQLASEHPSLGEPQVAAPREAYWPIFLTRGNLLNVANQIAVIAIIAIGMTMVIITRGIDLSVGSLIALSGVATALLVRDTAGGASAGTGGLVLCSAAGIGLCAALGLFSGGLITWCSIPPFIATLGMMLVGRGLAFMLAEGQSISDLPASFNWLGGGKDLWGVPNSVVLMIVLYAIAHVVMTRTVLGRYIYAVGGNPEGARLSGLPVRGVLLLVYTVSGLLAGVGGVITASQLGSGAPETAEMKELYVIAAVVVGGASLAGGEGKILGTLVGALIIAVIENGMNLTGVESYTQKVVLGLVILGAVLIDTMKRRGWGILLLRRRAAYAK